MLFLKLLSESFILAFGAMAANRLRTFLSLLGITIGILAIISVFTVVDGMKDYVRNSVQSLGDDIIYVHKWPWEFGGDYPWWKYWQRPVPSVEDAEELQRRLKTAQGICFRVGTKKTVTFLNNSVESVDVNAVSHDWNKIRDLNLLDGRYFTSAESASGRNVGILGYEISNALFGDLSPVGKMVKMGGKRILIIGKLDKDGESIFGNNKDNYLIVPINFARNLFNLRKENLDPMVMVKAKPGISNEELKDEITGVLRSVRRLKPSAENNFALNETSLISKGFEGLFILLDFAGWFIGGFSILVGGFGIANIMFVSVRERTSQIGIQKALGAKNYFILFQFLFEAILLCLMGGVIGLVIVFLIVQAVNAFLDMEMALTWFNIMRGILISVIIGLVSGIIPAFSASRLDPVEAIRSNG
ncbi:MAG: ABC transporter permease [Bacteroidia bacterium]|nr:ABC transporter permease [Bacteroidia bacterium]